MVPNAPRANIERAPQQSSPPNMRLLGVRAADALVNYLADV
jgi:hypothetical protein